MGVDSSGEMRFSFLLVNFPFQIGVLDEIDGSGGGNVALGGLPKGGLSPSTSSNEVYTHLSFEGKAHPLSAWT